jgi:molecular chaperone DnaK
VVGVAEVALGGERITDIVITCPASFGTDEREATANAGRLAGLNVRAILNEPTDAIAYELEQAEDQTVLVYDLGGGTFDVTVTRISPEEIGVLSTVGDHDLGGRNWDDRIATYLSEKFAADTGIDPLDDPMALNEVLVRSERAKCTLSERTATRITLQLGSAQQSFELTRAEFEAMTFPLMDRTRRLTEERSKRPSSTGSS